MSYVVGLQCRECGQRYEAAPAQICELCFGPLEVAYDYDAMRQAVTRGRIEAGPSTMWRYADLLPVDGPASSTSAGWTPLIRAPRLGAALGLSNLYLKDETVNHPTLSVKDRVVSVALARAREFGFETVACASTGNLAHSLAAHAASGGFRACIFVPADVEPAKVLGTLICGARLLAVSGTYDEVNRLCAEAAARHRWAFANINLRPYYGEGAKTVGYEIAEQMGWHAPDHVVVPCGGGSVISRLYKGLEELALLGLIGPVTTRMHAAQAAGCNPIAALVKAGAEVLRPVRPSTVARSLAIGNPVDGTYAAETVRRSGGWAEDAADADILECIALLARTEGIFAEPAGGVAVAAARKLVAQGRIGRDDSVVIVVTGSGHKAPEAVAGDAGRPTFIQPNLQSLETALRL